MPSALIIGADGLIGGKVLRQLPERGSVTVATTRRLDGDAALVRFDLSDPPVGPAGPPTAGRLRSEEPCVAFLVAAVAGYAQCAQDPVGTRRINVTNHRGGGETDGGRRLPRVSIEQRSLRRGLGPILVATFGGIGVRASES